MPFFSDTIVEHLKLRVYSGDSVLLYFYCSYNDPGTQSFRNFLCFCANELLRKDSICSQEILTLCESKKRLRSDPISKTDRLLTAEYLALLKKLSRNWNKLLILVDALDECQEMDKLEEFAEGLKSLCSHQDHGGATNIQVLVTSRNGWDIERKMASLVTTQFSLMANVQSDIDLYLKEEVGRRLKSGELKLRKQELAQHIISVLKEKAEGM